MASNPVVHVRDEAAGVCRPALVLVMPYDRHRPIRARVIRPSGVGAGGEGLDDEEGLFAPSESPIRVADDTRTLDHWHSWTLCPFIGHRDVD